MSNEETVDVGHLRTLASELMTTRMAMMRGLGMSYNGQRNIYDACGYPRVLVHQNFYDRYLRGDIATRIVEAYPDACWKAKPIVYDVRSSDQKPSKFESATRRLFKKVNLQYYARKADILCGLGRYSILFLGFDDNEDLTQPVAKGANLLYVQAYRESYAMISSLVRDVTDPRYGKPDFYSIVFATGFQAGSGLPPGMGTANSPGSQNQSSGGQVEGRVHWSRVIHLCENPIDGDIFGTSRMQSVWNRLQDIETVVSGSGEMFWRGAFPGTVFSADKDARFTDEDKKDFSEALDNYVNGLQRYIRTKGITAQQLTPGAVSPLNHVQANLWLISACTKIPYRILTGSEEGELAGSQDTDNWHGSIDGRRHEFCDPVVLRPLVVRLIEVEALPPPEQDADAEDDDLDFKTEWDEAREEDPGKLADNGLKKMQTATAYISGGVETIIPKEKFLKDYMGVPPEDVEGYLEAGDEVAAAQQAQADADRQASQQTAVATAHAVTAAKMGQPPPNLPGAKPPPAPKSALKTQEFHINPSWVEDEDIWAEAKKSALKNYKEDDEGFYAIVTSIYKKMGGKVKDVKQNALQRFAAMVTGKQNDPVPAGMSTDDIMRFEIKHGVPRINSMLGQDWETQARYDTIEAEMKTLGGEGSGNFDHSGRPGEVGGSSRTIADIQSDINMALGDAAEHKSRAQLASPGSAKKEEYTFRAKEAKARAAELTRELKKAQIALLPRARSKIGVIFKE